MFFPEKQQSAVSKYIVSVVIWTAEVTVSLHSVSHQQLSLLQNELDDGLPLSVDLCTQTEKNMLLKILSSPT